MNTVELIIKKRTGKAFAKEEINFLINSYTKSKIPDYQFSALLMAILLKGMSKAETSYLTKAMLHSGKVIDLSSIKGPKIDKHAGVSVPMISGRGLGHTGGTLDKLESIPGFRTDLSLKEYKSVLKECGAVLIGQTKDIAPADKLIYSLRDVTGTVESIPLITGSIMSKKLAEGIDGLVLDVKTGSGAFMRETKDAIELAVSLMNTAKAFNIKVIAFITDMNQPLGNYIGNWLEVYESIKVLRGKQGGDLLDLSLNLSGAMINLGGKAGSITKGVEIAKEQINNGKAFEKFVQMVKLQGGNTKFILHPEKYPKSKFIRKIKTEKSGYVKSIDNYQIGMAALELGAGRKTKTDIIDPKAGIIFKIKLGGKIKKGQVIAELHSQSLDKISTAKELILSAIKYSKQKTTKPKLIKKIIK